MGKTVVMIKPDAVKRGLTEAIFTRFAHHGLTVYSREETTLTKSEAESLYYGNRLKPSYDKNACFMSSGPIVVAVLEGHGNVVAKAREVIGTYDSRVAVPGTIRKDLGWPDADGILHVVHASDSEAAAEREQEWFRLRRVLSVEVGLPYFLQIFCPSTS